MALGAGNVLLLGVDLMACRIGYLVPFRVTAFMAFLARIIVNKSMLADPLRPFQREFDELFCSLYHVSFMAGMAGYIAVLAGAPSVPCFLHSVTGTAEVRVILHVVVTLKSKEHTDTCHHKKYQ